MTPEQRALYEALALRCEDAAGADRELDAEIAAAAGIIDLGEDNDYLRRALGDAFYRVSDDGRRVELWTRLEGGDERSLANREPRPFTRSIDIAMGLVPEGCGPMIQPGISGNMWAQIVRFTEYETELMPWRAKARTFPLALCAAALRALASQGDGE